MDIMMWSTCIDCTKFIPAACFISVISIGFAERTDLQFRSSQGY